jgi:3-phenylpropionate/trans-cinnamate dioxygenase ferredoxin subunit
MSQPSQTRHVIGLASELPPGSRKLIEIAGRAIGVFHVNGAYYALRNRCPHRGGPLCQGRIRPLVLPVGVTTALLHEREGEILKCPWHQWEFDLKTGQCLVDPHLRVKTYSVVQEGDELVVYV